MELKDENTAKEPLKDALKQAIAYTVFIRELLRSEAGLAWWRLFGFGGSIPDRLKLVAACVMPADNMTTNPLLAWNWLRTRTSSNCIIFISPNTRMPSLISELHWI